MISKTISLAVCLSVLFGVGCQKQSEHTEPKIKAEQKSPTAVEKSPRDLMFNAIRQNNKKLLGDACEIDEFDDSKKKLWLGDLNQDGKTDFIYDYSVINQCGAQTTQHILGIFLNSGSSYQLDSTYDAGLSELNQLNIESIDAKGMIQAKQDDQKVQFIYKDKTLNEVLDPHKKVTIELAKDTTVESSFLASEINQALYVPKEVECGGFFSDDQAEKSATIDRYDLRLADGHVAIMGVYGLTLQDEIRVESKTLTSASTLAQVQQLFKQGYETHTSKNDSAQIGSASDQATKLKYDLMFSARKKSMDDAYLFYFKDNRLIAVQYFIPC